MTDNLTFNQAPTVRDSLPSPNRSGVRKEMEALPKVLQPFLTWVVGVPATDETLPQPRPRRYLAKVCGLLLLGISLSCWALVLQGWGYLWLIVGWSLTVSASRQLQVVIVHHCAHSNFTGDRLFDQYLGRWISALMLILSFDQYRIRHRKHHQDPLLDDDETVEALRLRAGIHPGLSREALWRRMIMGLFSPLFHGRFWIDRVRSSLFSSDRAHQLRSGLVVLAQLGLVGFGQWWLAYGVAWLFPVILLHQMSTLIRQCSEHLHPAPEADLKKGKRYYARATVGIFLGDPLPRADQPFGSKFWQWCVWWLRLGMIYVPIRLLILVGDTSCHDYHHRHPGVDQWLNAAIARQRDVDAHHPGWPVPYQEVYGLWRAIDLSFTSLSLMPVQE
ncbi:hypothetical protein MiHa_04031 [Microcystis aeruginosa NIES-2522]|uniref:fatty acid desaturase n=1 Tax=Microcystis aeruginosa TaxID=1126 RepID=UPI00123098E4|nr:fatty acid desaturase [Microcystis aeruginosa]GCA86046.1 hypothetical protein MiHa_04031 [Microcystis aeruginosa NIES-2522]